MFMLMGETEDLTIALISNYLTGWQLDYPEDERIKPQDIARLCILRIYEYGDNPDKKGLVDFSRGFLMLFPLEKD